MILFKGFIFITVLFVLPSIALANDLEGDLLDCMKVTNLAERLDCFENLTKNVHSKVSVIPSASIGKWRVKQRLLH